MRAQRLCPQKGAGHADGADAGQTAVKQDKATRFLIAKSSLSPFVPTSDVAKRQLSDLVVGVSSLDQMPLNCAAVGQQTGCGLCERHNGLRRSVPSTPPLHTHTLFSELLVGGRAVWIVGQWDRRRGFRGPLRRHSELP